jgi:hypothetical protein
MLNFANQPTPKKKKEIPLFQIKKFGKTVTPSPDRIARYAVGRRGPLEGITQNPALSI